MNQTVLATSRVWLKLEELDRTVFFL
jgi:hypothetical protein